jgi:hypothetical protein
MTVIVLLLLVVRAAGCLLIAGLLWSLAASRACGQAGRELARWLRDPHTPRPIRIAVAVLVLGPVAYLLIGVAQVTADLLFRVAA